MTKTMKLLLVAKRVLARHKKAKALADEAIANARSSATSSGHEQNKQASNDRTRPPEQPNCGLD